MNNAQNLKLTSFLNLREIWHLNRVLFRFQLFTLESFNCFIYSYGVRILYVTICFRIIPIFLFLHWHALVRPPGAGYIKVSLQEELSMYMTLTAEHIITPSMLLFPSCARAAECCRFVWNGIGDSGLMGNFPEGTELRKCDSLPSARRKKKKKAARVALLSRNPPTALWKTASSSCKTRDASAVAGKQIKWEASCSHLFPSRVSVPGQQPISCFHVAVFPSVE